MTAPTREEFRDSLNDARIAGGIITALCDADINQNLTTGTDLACSVKWLVGIQTEALETIERGIGR